MSVAGENSQMSEKYGMQVKTSHLLQRRLSKGGKGQYFDSGDYNMQGSSGNGNADPSVVATRTAAQSKLASEAAPAVIPGPGPGAVRVPQRRKSQPSKLGGDQPSPTGPKQLSPMAASPPRPLE